MTVAEVDVAVRLRPRSGADAVVGVAAGLLVVRVSAPPVDERANRALCRVLARASGVSASSVTIVKGTHARDKLVRIRGIDRAGLELRLGLKLPARG